MFVLTVKSPQSVSSVSSPVLSVSRAPASSVLSSVVLPPSFSSEGLH